MGLRKPPLYDVHADVGATSTGFSGWDMLVEYDSIKTEHTAVRESVGIFDVSYMSKIKVSSPGATALTQRLTTNDVTALEPGDSRYSTIVNDEGVTVDDTVVYRLLDHDERIYLFTPSTDHDGETYDRWTSFRDDWDLDATVEDVTEDWAMFTVQGPDALDSVTDAVPDAVLGDLSKSQATLTDAADVERWVIRMGYTGEDGSELLCPWIDTETIWAAFEATSCRLGPHDTLRLEMGYLLLRQDFGPETEPRAPYETGIGFVVDLSTKFVGHDALGRRREADVEETFTGFAFLDRGVPRHDYDIVNSDGRVIGVVTSGTMSPTLSESIGLGYVPVERVDDETEVSVLVRGHEKCATVITSPLIN